MAVRVPPVMRRVRSATFGRPRLPARLSPLRLRLFAILGLLGPGLIAANAGNDAGGIATYASAGASYGYAFLWVMVVITVFMGIVQEMCARLGAVTGKGFSDLVRENFSLLSHLAQGCPAGAGGDSMPDNRRAVKPVAAAC